jgi:hypothetical protein
MLAIMKESAADVVGIRATGMMTTADWGRQQRRTPRRGDAGARVGLVALDVDNDSVSFTGGPSVTIKSHHPVTGGGGGRSSAHFPLRGLATWSILSLLKSEGG